MAEQETPEQEAEREAWELEVMADAHAETDGAHPVRRSVGYRNFTSTSKGVYRRTDGTVRQMRRRPREVVIVGYGTVIHSWVKFPFDEVATEIYGPSVPSGEAEAQLMADVPRYADRGGWLRRRRGSK